MAATAAARLGDLGVCLGDGANLQGRVPINHGGVTRPRGNFILPLNGPGDLPSFAEAGKPAAWLGFQRIGLSAYTSDRAGTGKRTAEGHRDDDTHDNLRCEASHEKSNSLKLAVHVSLFIFGSTRKETRLWRLKACFFDRK